MSNKMTSSLGNGSYASSTGVKADLSTTSMSTTAMHFTCPRCHGSQYRTSPFDMSESNPYGAKCIFCKSAMVAKAVMYTPDVHADKRAVGMM